MITLSITPEMISLHSLITPDSVRVCRWAIPSPRMKARTKAVITPMTGGISMWK